MKRRGHLAEVVDEVVFQNPGRFLRQCLKFRL